eukprot:CAMPEP_0197498082 /NCGR_PEP_ID=MMETSP1311-20131121/55467_1 /TAXON_ID=464262 /ORGANISM="Genus nov. species nov., Strain RCC856" /LENGTH=111 /DNA_ID=CAMNT_0043043781 /DNA_START=126 /DNA_END=458 /DNA_ORIENTATION=-
MTMKTWGGHMHAPWSLTTLEWLTLLRTSTSFLKTFNSLSSLAYPSFTATSFPFQRPLYTSPKAPRPMTSSQITSRAAMLSGAPEDPEAAPATVTSTLAASVPPLPSRRSTE